MTQTGKATLAVDGAAEAVIATTDFDSFYAASVRRTVAVAYALTGSWADAEDLAQDAYSAAARGWAHVGRLDDPAAWVRRAVINRSRSRWRRLGREVRALTRLAGRGPQTEETTLADPAFWSAVSELPSRQREVVALYYVDDLPMAEIAARLGCAEGTVKVHLSRARAALAAALGTDWQGAGA